MASAKVHVTKQSIYRALNTPGGPIYEWRDRMMHETQDRATTTAPINNPANARHRGGGVGRYKAGFRTRRTGNQNGVGAVIFNNVDHAIYVEEGRSESTKFQVFSWTAWHGEIHYINGAGPIPNYPLPFGGRKTAARPGRHILANALKWAYRRNV